MHSLMQNQLAASDCDHQSERKDFNQAHFLFCWFPASPLKQVASMMPSKLQRHQKQ